MEFENKWFTIVAPGTNEVATASYEAPWGVEDFMSILETIAENNGSLAFNIGGLQNQRRQQYRAWNLLRPKTTY